MNREQLDEIRTEWAEQNERHLAAHGAWRCCSACTMADKRVPALLAEIDRLTDGISKTIAEYERTATEYDGIGDDDFAEDCRIAALKLQRILANGARPPAEGIAEGDQSKGSSTGGVW